MSKLGYREKMLKLYNEKIQIIEGDLKDISLSDLTYRFLTNISEIRELMEDVFDTPFWEDVLENNIIEERLREGGDFIVFEIKEIPFGLVSLSSEEDEEREIYQFDIEDFLFGRNNGLGEKVVDLLRCKIYSDEMLFGYAVSESVKFWSRHADLYDAEVYESMKEEHIADGGEEDELFEVEGLMYFEL